MDWKALYHSIAHPPWMPQRVDRWHSKTPGGYVFDTRIFYFVTILCLGLGLYLSYTEFGMFTDNFVMEKVYLSCPTGGGLCTNPYYGKCYKEYCLQEVLPEGYVYGEKAGPLYDAYLPTCLGGLMLAFLLNHFIYNKSYELSEE